MREQLLENFQLQEELLLQEEERYIDEKLEQLEDQMKRFAEQEMEWETVKQLSKEYKLMREEKFSIPSENKDDWYDKLPKAFYSLQSGVDIFGASEDSGFESIDSFIDYLQTLDKAHKTRKKDIVDYSLEFDLFALEEELRQEFRETSQGRNLIYALEMFEKELENSEN